MYIVYVSNPPYPLPPLLPQKIVKRFEFTLIRRRIERGGYYFEKNQAVPSPSLPLGFHLGSHPHSLSFASPPSRRGALRDSANLLR